MGTSKQGGWTLRLPEGRGRKTYLVRFRHAGKRVERSTGKSDPREAAIEAARIYADVVSGRQTTRVAVAEDLAKAFASWLADYETTHAKGTAETVTMYVEAHLLPFFGSFDRFTPASIGDYMRQRIQKATRATVRKELSALRQFFAWCEEHGTTGLPPVLSLPKKGHPGVRAKNARRPKHEPVTEAEIHRILAAMPERSRRTGEWVRPLFTVLWETGLRESTILRLRTPEHYRRRGRRLFITEDIDKAHYKRPVPLTDAARKALDRVCPKVPGLLFAGVDEDSLRFSLEAAASAAGIERHVSTYDIRHGRASQLANSGAPLAGVARLLGHVHVSTTSKYVHADDDAAEAALEAVRRRRPARKRTPRPQGRGVGAPRLVVLPGGHSGGHKAKTGGANGGS